MYGAACEAWLQGGAPPPPPSTTEGIDATAAAHEEGDDTAVPAAVSKLSLGDVLQAQAERGSRLAAEKAQLVRPSAGGPAGGGIVGDAPTHYAGRMSQEELRKRLPNVDDNDDDDDDDLDGDFAG